MQGENEGTLGLLLTTSIAWQLQHITQEPHKGHVPWQVLTPWHRAGEWAFKVGKGLEQAEQVQMDERSLSQKTTGQCKSSASPVTTIGLPHLL